MGGSGSGVEKPSLNTEGFPKGSWFDPGLPHGGLVSKSPWARLWTPSCSRWAGWCLAWFPLPSVYECVCEWVNEMHNLQYVKRLGLKVLYKCTIYHLMTVMSVGSNSHQTLCQQPEVSNTFRMCCKQLRMTIVSSRILQAQAEHSDWLEQWYPKYGQGQSAAAA